jgi:hypothetical protein
MLVTGCVQGTVFAWMGRLFTCIQYPPALQQALTLADENGLCQEIYANVAGIMSFASYFVHCGYTFN